MKVKISQNQFQHQVLAPVMQQSIEILLLPIMDLNMTIEEELQNNPLLEIDELEQRVRDKASEDDFNKKLERILDAQHEEYRDTYILEEETWEERPIKREETLEENLLKQLRIEFSDPLQLMIGEFLIGNLNEDGYLMLTTEEVGTELRIQDKELIEHVLKKIQRLDPPGIASRDLKECLLAQIHIGLNGNGRLIEYIVENFLIELGQKKYQEIAKKSGKPLEDIKEAYRFISQLDPKPARNFRPISPNIYIKPDVIVIKNAESEFQIQLNEEGTPPLRINKYYKDLLLQNNLTPDEKSFIREKLKSAMHFIKSLQQRGQTLQRITQYILDKQKKFFEYGPLELVPMTLKDVAQAIDRNESTISRAINNKYISTPQGLFNLKFFFSQPVGKSDKGPVSNQTIKEEIKSLIKAEDKNAPLSDHHIQQYFEAKGMKIARRTISKYRQALNILPSHLRKQ